jgi:hypothetical protein
MAAIIADAAGEQEALRREAAAADGLTPPGAPTAGTPGRWPGVSKLKLSARTQNAAAVRRYPVLRATYPGEWQGDVTTVAS